MLNHQMLTHINRGATNTLHHGVTTHPSLDNGQSKVSNLKKSDKSLVHGYVETEIASNRNLIGIMMMMTNAMMMIMLPSVMMMMIMISGMMMMNDENNVK